MPFKSPSVSSRPEAANHWSDLWFKLGLTALFAGVMAAKAQAAPVVEPFLPHAFDASSGTSTIYYVHSGITTAMGWTADHAIDPEFGSNNLQTVGAYTFYYRLTNLDANQNYVYVYAEGSDENTNYAIPVAACAGGATCESVSTNPAITRVYTNGQTQIDIGLNFGLICASTSNSTGAAGCTAGTFDVGASAAGLRLKIIQATTTSAPTDSATINAGFIFKVIPEVAPPTLASSCPALSAWFFPGDGSIFAETGTLLGQKATTGNGTTKFDKFVVTAQRDTLGAFPANPFNVQNDTANDDPAVINRGAYNSGSQEFQGFSNSTNAEPREYLAKIGVRDTAGVAVFCPTAFTVFASDIQSFLKESNCFVATASFRSGRAEPVMLLRKFRDHVLAKSEIGRKFISFYYREGPKAADWLLQNPEFRIPALSLLVPVEILAWVALHPNVLWIPLFAFLGFIFFVPRARGNLRRGFTVSLFIAGGSLTAFATVSANAAESVQPFIDSLLSEIEPSKDPVRTSENPDPYIQRLKKNLGPDSGPAEGYTEEERKLLGEGTDSKGYTEELRKRVGKKPGGDSAIADLRSGRELKPNKGNLRTRSAFAFKVSAAMNRTYDAGTAQDLTYEEVYGNGYVPELTLAYEYRPFTGPVVRNLGILGSLGGSWKTASGQFAYGPAQTFGKSKAKFRFITLPVNVGPIYRFSFFDFIYPYMGAGGSAVGFIETRTDDKEGMRGYSFGTWGVLGVSFGLDWISPKSSWDQYQSSGVKHTYLSVEYSYLATYGGLIEATVDGVQAGLTFEF